MKDEDLQFDRTCHVPYAFKCDYTICGDRDEYLKEHPEYVDEEGFRRNT